MSLLITVCHHLANLVMSIGNPGDRFFYPTLTLMMVSYIIFQDVKIEFNPAVILQSTISWLGGI